MCDDENVSLFLFLLLSLIISIIIFGDRVVFVFIFKMEKILNSFEFYNDNKCVCIRWCDEDDGSAIVIQFIWWVAK